MRVDCPKCRSPNAWVERDDKDLTLRCLCGYLKVIETVLENITTRHTEVGIEVALPRSKTKLWYCLNMLVGLEPVTTQELTFRLNLPRMKEVKKEVLTVSDVASQLTVLRYKGLVDTLESRKGLPGGSTWITTVGARRLLGKE